jgi:hypothetical protein
VGNEAIELGKFGSGQVSKLVHAHGVAVVLGIVFGDKGEVGLEDSKPDGDFFLGVDLLKVANKVVKQLALLSAHQSLGRGGQGQRDQE